MIVASRRDYRITAQPVGDSPLVRYVARFETLDSFELYLSILGVSSFFHLDLCHKLGKGLCSQGNEEVGCQRRERFAHE